MEFGWARRESRPYTDLVTRARWLNESEMRAWRAFIETVGDLTTALEHDLVPHGVTMGDYQVLVYLDEAEGRSMRMCDLAARLQLSPSGLTRRLDGLVRQGLVERVNSTEDRRVMLATLTPAGLARLVEAAPTHVESVRRHLIDRLTPEQIETLGAIFTTVGASLRNETANV
jgi:DNA-binding MarR family transcriptional regulator